MVLDFGLRPEFSVTSRFALIRFETGLLRLSSVLVQTLVLNFGLSGSLVSDFGLRPKFSVTSRFALIRS